MADFEVLERFGDGRLRLRLTEGRLAGRVVIAFPDIPPLLSPYERADRLLRSLLTAEQIEDWETFEKFRVPSPFGILEFGQIFDIGPPGMMTYRLRTSGRTCFWRTRPIPGGSSQLQTGESQRDAGTSVRFLALRHGSDVALGD
jgi:hypothetical protein